MPILGAIGSIIGGNQIAAGEQQAGQTLQQYGQQAVSTQQNMFGQTQQNVQPYLTGGTNALSALQSMLGLTPGGTGTPNYAALTSTPGYQFQMQQGLGAIQGNAAATGGASGNTLQALTQYGQGLAGNTFNNYLSQLNNLVSGGRTSALGLGGISSSVGSSIGGDLMSTGNALAGTQLGAAEAQAGGLQGALSGLGGLLGGSGGLGSLLSGLFPGSGGGSNYFGAGGGSGFLSLGL